MGVIILSQIWSSLSFNNNKKGNRLKLEKYLERKVVIKKKSDLDSKTAEIRCDSNLDLF